ncbi:DNA polymerase V [Cryptosporidium felis]|nr:DNA polymerase V [Cryptosporidium felis]
MDNPEFLQYFWDLGSCEENVSASSIEGILRCLDSVLNGSGASGGKEVGVKQIVTLTEVNTGRGDLEYTLSRLVKGLESQRECVRRGYSACLSIVLDRYKVPASNVLEGLEKHYLEGMKKEIKGKGSFGVSGEVRDRIIGLLLGYLVIIKTGFFRSNQSRPYIQQTIENLWMVYGAKLYLQDLICEVIYLIIKDSCEYDPRLPSKFAASKFGGIFDSRFLESGQANESIKAQLASNISILALFLKLRLFVEERKETVIHGVTGCDDLSQVSGISVTAVGKWEDWNKTLFSPGYPFHKQKWEIILGSIQHFTLFSPRIPSFLFVLVEYLTRSPCLTEKLTSVLLSDIIREIEEKYFSGPSSPQKHFFGGRMILQVFVQLKIAAFSDEHHNFSEKVFSKVLKGYISGNSNSLYSLLKSSLNNSRLSIFSAMFARTLVELITGGIFNNGSKCSSKSSESEVIQGFSSFVFGTLEDSSQQNIQSLIPYLVNETVSGYFWTTNEGSVNLDGGLPYKLEGLKSSLGNSILNSAKERARLFWILSKPFILKTGPQMRILIRIFSDLLASDDHSGSCTISQGILLIREILEEDSTGTLEKQDPEIEPNSELGSNQLLESRWRKVQWVHNVMLEFLQASFNSSRENKNISSFALKLSTQFCPLLDSILSFGILNKDWVESYRQAVFPRLEKISSRITGDIVVLLDNEHSYTINESTSRTFEAYNEKIVSIFTKTSHNVDSGQDSNLNENTASQTKQLFEIISKRKSPTSKSELCCNLIENCLLIYYLMEDCSSNIIFHLISTVICSDNTSKLNTVLDSMVKIDSLIEDRTATQNILNSNHSETRKESTEDLEDSPSCIAGVSFLFLQYLKILNLSENLNTEKLVELSRVVSQLPDLWSSGNQLIDENDEDLDEEMDVEIQEDDSLDTDKISQLLEPNTFSADKVDFDLDEGEESEDEEISYNDDNALFSHLLNDENTPLPPKYKRRSEQKELERQQMQRINYEMQNKLRMLEVLSLISDLYKPVGGGSSAAYMDLLRSVVLLIEGFRLGCKHTLYYSMRSSTSVFSDYVNKLGSTINRIMHNELFKGGGKLLSMEDFESLGDLFKLLIHIVSKPIVEPQTASRWSKKSNGKQLKSRMEGYSKQFETLSLNLMVSMINSDLENQVVGKLVAQNLVKKWISQKRLGIVTSSFLTKLIHKIKASNDGSSYTKFLVEHFINNFEDTIKSSKSSYQLREYTTLINQTLAACSPGLQNEKDVNRNYLYKEVTGVVVKMIDSCIRQESQNIEGDIKFTTSMQRLELLRILISLSKSIIGIGNPADLEDLAILQVKINESNDFLNNFNQNCNSGKMKRQINRLKNIINSSNTNKKVKIR